MSIIRIQKSKNFTIMSNVALRDKDLSLKAKGLWATMMSCNDDWTFTIDGLVAMTTDGKDSVRSGLKELEQKNYLVRIPTKDKGQFGYDYTVYETPYRENRVGKSDAVNPTQINTNTEKLNKKDISSKFIPPAKAEVQDYIKAQGYHFNSDEFYDYYASANWHKADGKPVRNWKQCCVTWESTWKKDHPNATQTTERRKKLL